MARPLARAVITRGHGPVLTAAEMQAAETASRIPLVELMARAGAALGETVRRFSNGAAVTILCGTGNNGGDGYVAAAVLRRLGATVAVAATGEPRTELARAAAARWEGPVVGLGAAVASPILVDCVFGIGLSRPLDATVMRVLRDLRALAALTIAADLPSGVACDSGADLGSAGADITLAFGALKPAHLLQPAAQRCGRVLLAPLGLHATSTVAMVEPDLLPLPGPADHKYTRGMVVIVGGAMPGAATLAASAAARSGAGYVLLTGEGRSQAIPSAIVTTQRALDDVLADRRIDAVVVGPGLGRDDAARVAVATVLARDVPAVIDGDALRLMSVATLRARTAPTILTPHAGEFDALFGDSAGDKVTRTRAAAVTAQATVVHKGADTVIAAPDGKIGIAAAASPWLATAGTGDVLAGVIGTLLARGLEPFAAACTGVWLHGQAAAFAGPGLIADDLLAGLRAALRTLR